MSAKVTAKTVRCDVKDVAAVLAEIKRLLQLHNRVRASGKNEEGVIRLFRNAYARIDTLNMLGIISDEEADELEQMFYE